VLLHEVGEFNMKFLVFALLALFAVSCFAELTEQQLQVEFTNFMQQHKKSYTVDEFQYRFQVFKQNARFIDSFNGQNKTFTVAMNKFGDLTSEEFGKIYLGFRGMVRTDVNVDQALKTLPQGPASWDWRTKGAVTQIKNQGQCGSCWSFSATGSGEGSHFLSGQALVALSEQQLVDCSGSYGNQGCNGGLMDDAFQYMMKYGEDSEAAYPYTAQDGYCQYSASGVVAKFNGYHDIPSGSETDLYNAIWGVAPISVAIDASHTSFQFYSSGVYYEPACSSTQLDHGVLAIGFGASGSADYYIVKNSWGTDWGMSGYIWMSRNRNNNCGIATMSSYVCTANEPNCPATL